LGDGVIGSLLWRIWMLSSLPPTATSLHSINIVHTARKTFLREEKKKFGQHYTQKSWTRRPGSISIS
jgi:hypothetical protein